MRIPGLQLDGPLDDLPWRATRHAGIEWIDLGEADGPARTALIRMAPGRGYPRHRHVGAEDVLVLDGGYEDDDGRRVRAGDHVRYAPGSIHAPRALGDAGAPVDASNRACVLFAVAHAGTEVLDDVGDAVRGDAR